MKVLAILLLALGGLLAAGGWSAADAGQHVHAPAAQTAEVEAVTENAEAVTENAAVPAPETGCVTSACCASLCSAALPPPLLAAAGSPAAGGIVILSDSWHTGVTPGGLLRPPRPARVIR